jgi:hypothetical protein
MAVPRGYHSGAGHQAREVGIAILHSLGGERTFGSAPQRQNAV